MIDSLEKIDNKNRQVFLRGNDLFFIPVTNVCDMSDNLIGLVSGEVEVPVDKVMESLSNASINKDLWR